MSRGAKGLNRPSAILASLVGVVAWALASSALAQDDGAGWYIGANIPLMFIDDTESFASGENFEPITVGYDATALNEYGTGYKIGATVGYIFPSGLRVEFEAYRASADVVRLTYSGVSVPAIGFSLPEAVDVAITGAATQTAFVLNAWYDFDTVGQWTPYVGAGFGQLRVDMGDVEYDTNGLAQAVADAVAAASGFPVAPQLPPGYIPQLSTEDTTMAWHFGAGASWELSASTSLQVGYRYQASGNVEFNGANSNATANSLTEQKTHFIELGIRYRL